MCGIAGLWDQKHTVTEDALKRMAGALRHRGPDDERVFIDRAHNIGLAHRRLSVIDLSEGGRQPMERGDLVVSYNGEIYNFKEIRTALQVLGIRFTSGSDTEVLLRAIDVWGMDALHRFRGMFAFALWNRKERILTLCRDRAGVKPLYYFAEGGCVAFASELKALFAHPAVTKELDTDSLALFLSSGFIPSPHTIFKKIRKVEPGHLLKVGADGTISDRAYWDIAGVARIEAAHPYRDEHTVLSETEDVLAEAFRLRMVADVPVGVFLSGGIDSSLVAALLSRSASQPLKTFTVGFSETQYDEAGYAKQIARHLGTDHHELYLSTERAVEIVAKLPEMFDEPYAGASAIPTFFVSEFAKREVTVALSADGGDELFSGYGRKYPMLGGIYRKYAALPGAVGLLARMLRSPLTEAAYARSPRLSLLAAQRKIAETYALLNKSVFSESEVRSLVQDPVRPGYVSTYASLFESMKDLDPELQFQLFDFKVNLADNILAKVDRASMAVSLESREPFLDPRVIEQALSIPESVKRKGGEDKYLLKRILYRHVPRELVDRPKHGFSMPLEGLLKNGPRDLVSEYLDERKIRRAGILNAEAVMAEKGKFFAGKASPRGIWRLVMFQMWNERWNA